MEVMSQIQGHRTGFMDFSPLKNTAK